MTPTASPPVGIRVLLLEDNPRDAEIILRELRRAGYDPDWQRVETEQDFLVALDQPLDLILSDFSLPHFDGLQAVAAMHSRGLDIPFILVSGTMGEEAAIRAIQHGIDDYLLKDNLLRFGTAVANALAKKRLREERRKDEREKQLAADHYRQSVERQAAVLDALPAHIALLDAQGEIIAVNRSWRRFAGTEGAPDGGAFLGRNYLEVCQSATGQEAQDAQAAAAGIQQVLRGESREFSMSYACPSPSERRWFRLVVGPMSEQGPAGAIVMHIDVTREIELESQLRQSQKMEAIGQLAGGVAHDFNNILAVIVLQADIGSMSPAAPPEILSILSEIRGAAERAARLTQQLLLFGRRELMRPRPVDLNEVVTNLSKMLQRLIREDVTLQLRLSPEPQPVLADAGMIDQVLMNLAVNARAAMPGGGMLVIETSSQRIDSSHHGRPPELPGGDYVCLCVTDTGCGIAPEIREKIFDPFFTTKDAASGTGLGLATVFGIIKQHSGWIEVESEVGQGSSFLVFLPLTQATKKLSSRPDRSARDGPRGSERILLVEDDRGLRLVTTAVLTRYGYTVVAAEDGQAARRLWEEQRGQFQLLLTDMVMPGGLTGRDLAQGLLENSPDLKVLFTSGYSSELAGRQLHLPAGQDFLQKPASTDQLLRSVRKLLDTPLGA